LQYSEAIQLLQNIHPDPSRISTIRTNIISCLFSLGQTDDALRELDRSFQEMKSAGKTSEPEYFALKETALSVSTKILSKKCNESTLKLVFDIIRSHFPEEQ